MLNSENIVNATLKNTGEIVTKNLESKEIETDGNINVVEGNTANSLLNLSNGEIVAKGLNISDIEKCW